MTELVPRARVSKSLLDFLVSIANIENIEQRKDPSQMGVIGVSPDLCPY